MVWRGCIRVDSEIIFISELIIHVVFMTSMISDSMIGAPIGSAKNKFFDSKWNFNLSESDVNSIERYNLIGNNLTIDGIWKRINVIVDGTMQNKFRPCNSHTSSHAVTNQLQPQRNIFQIIIWPMWVFQIKIIEMHKFFLPGAETKHGFGCSNKFW